MSKVEAARAALAKAEIEDALDATLAPCKLCGHWPPYRNTSAGSESLYRSDVYVSCPKGCQKLTINADQYNAMVWRPGVTGWESMGAAEQLALKEAMRRWNILNHA